ncbi:MAG TPA: hypothetical protein DEH27_11085 [Deltaproteobacteria bacterium]|nr:hypothetical protein [Deltaproteobacteria bacterium]
MIIRCPLCQYKIDTNDRGCHTGCPMGKSCSLVCCPRCHYSFPVPESKVVNFVRSLLSKGSRR